MPHTVKDHSLLGNIVDCKKIVRDRLQAAHRYTGIGYVAHPYLQFLAFKLDDVIVQLQHHRNVVLRSTERQS